MTSCTAPRWRATGIACVAMLITLLASQAVADEHGHDDLDRVVRAEMDQRLQRRAALETAQHQVELVELQAKMAAALARCAEIGANCGVDAGLDSLTVAPPAPVTSPEEAVAPLSAEHPPVIEPSDAHVGRLPPVDRPMPVPAPPRLMGIMGSLARFQVDDQLIDVAQGESLHGGWTVASITLRGVTVSHANGDTRRLTLSWATAQSPSPTPGPTASASTSPLSPPPFFPLPGYPQ